ncbi:MAG: glutathione S-transferase C-terminal domain-containing protein [Oleispira sp.]
MAYMKQGCWLPDEDKEGLTYTDTFDDFGEVEAGRYHLYISYACPFAHRPYLVHSLMGLGDAISISSMAANRHSCGWAFDETDIDPLFGYSHLQQLYTQAKPDFTGRITVPVLWDKKRNVIASNDSASIAQWFNDEWQSIATKPNNLSPTDQRDVIDELCEWLNEQINVGVYKAGFAKEQASYDSAFDDVFKALDELDIRLSTQRFLHGNTLTMSDVRLIPSLLRFDSVYYFHFKLNNKRIQDYANLWGYLLDAMQIPEVVATFKEVHLKQHYFYSHNFINPTRIVPKGPVIDWFQTHDRSNKF